MAGKHIKRRFMDLPHGQLHYRTAGEGAPLLLLHGSPGSSLQQVRLIEDLADDFRVIAPDTPGNGDSDRLPKETPEIEDLAAAMFEMLDALGIDRVQLYGFHTGGAIGGEMTIQKPDRVRNLVIDGILEPDDEYRRELLENYAKPFPADLDGAYLARIFQFCRDQFVYFPWYRRTPETLRMCSMTSADGLKTWVQEVLKANETYHLNYNASFRWPATEKFTHLGANVHVLASESDPVLGSARALMEKYRNIDFRVLPAFESAGYRAERLSTLKSIFC